MTRSLFLPLAMIALLAGCSASRTAPDASGPYAGIPTARAEAPVAEAQPVAPTGDMKLDGFLADFAAAIDRHDWYAVAQAMEAEAFAEQRSLIERERASGAAAQIIGETIGLGDLVDYSGDRPWNGFESIRVVTLRDMATNTPGIAGGEMSFTIGGDVRVEGGRTYPIQFTVVQRGGAYTIQVPLG